MDKHHQVVVDKLYRTENLQHDCCSSNLKPEVCRFFMHRCADNSLWVMTNELLKCTVCGTYYATEDLQKQYAQTYSGFELTTGKRYNTGQGHYTVYSSDNAKRADTRDAEKKAEMQKQPLRFLQERPSKCGNVIHRLGMKKAEFYIRHATNHSLLIVKEELYYCTTCNSFYADKILCRNILKKYPGYTLELMKECTGKSTAKKYATVMNTSTVSYTKRNDRVSAKQNIPKHLSEQQDKPVRKCMIPGCNDPVYRNTTMCMYHLSEDNWRSR